MRAEGLVSPERVVAAIDAYRLEADVLGAFLGEYTVETEGNRLPTGELYTYYSGWAKDNGYRPMNNKTFVAELRRRYDVRRDSSRGNVVVGLVLGAEPSPL